MIDWILSRKCRNPLTLHIVDQLVRSAKNETLFYLPEPGIRRRLDGMIMYRRVCVSEKRKTIIKWKLSTCKNFVNLRTEGVFVELCHSKIYTMWMVCQKYIQYNIYNEDVIPCRVFSRWCIKSYMPLFLEDDAQQLRNYFWEYGEYSE